MKSRRGGEAEDTHEIICAGFGAEAPGNLLLALWFIIRHDYVISSWNFTLIHGGTEQLRSTKR